MPPGGFPLGDAGQDATRRTRPPSSTPIRASPAPRRWPTSTLRSALAATSSSSAPSSTTSWSNHEPIFRKAATRAAHRRASSFFPDYLIHYTNAATIVTEEFKDTEENDFAGLFAGYDPEKRHYDNKKWCYEIGTGRKPKVSAAGRRANRIVRGRGRQAGRLAGPARLTLQHERACVWQILKKHYPALHAGAGRAGLRHAAGDLPQGRRCPAGQCRPGPHRRHLLRASAGRSTPSACR